MMLARALPVVSAFAFATSIAGAAPPPATFAADEIAKGEIEMRTAEADGAEKAKRAKAASAITHFEASYEAEPSWRAAAGACDANLFLGLSAVASSWYWLASDDADYSDPYLVWQKSALSRVFDNRAAFTFQYSETPATLRIDGAPIPPNALERPIALELGTHALIAGSADGNSFQGSLDVTADKLGGRHFFHVAFEHMLKAGEADPNGTTVGPRPKKDTGGKMSVLQIVTIVGTVTLAAGIAVGGGYLLFGRDNPRGLDTAEGAAVVISELVVIGVGTAIALISD